MKELFSENISKEYDVIVCGGGPAGCCAAISASRAGMSTLLIEATSALGGMGTMGMVSAFAPFTDGEKLIYSSLPLEILTRYKKRMNIPEWKWEWIKLSPEDLKRVYDDITAESKTDVLFQSIVCSAETENGRIKQIYAANKSGITAYRAKVYIDCTGDGDLAAYCGVPFEMGQDGEVQSASLCFAISNVDTDKINTKINSNFDDGIWPKIIADGKYPLISRHFIPVYFGDTLIVNGGHLFIENPTDTGEISRAYILGRQTAEQYLAALKEYLPEAFSDSFPDGASAMKSPEIHTGLTVTRQAAAKKLLRQVQMTTIKRVTVTVYLSDVLFPKALKICLLQVAAFRLKELFYPAQELCQTALQQARRQVSEPPLP